MTTPYERLAGLVRSRRTELRLTQLQVAATAGVSESTVRALETGRRNSYRQTTMRAVSEALGWTPDSIERIIDGNEPVIAGDDDTDATPDLVERVAALEAALARIVGQLNRIAPDARSYPVDLDDPEERELWGLSTLPGSERWALIVHLRERRRAGRGRATG